MNERIRELAGQVCDTLHDGDWNIPNEFIEKFAELIVQECIDQVEVFNARMDARPRHIAAAIREHFGVEE